jgi:hypothetical protein
VVDGRTLGHQSNRRNTRTVGKPHHHVVEKEGSLASAASSERDTSSNNDYNSKGEESEGFELPVASSIMKEQTKAPNKRTPTPNVMYSPPIFKYCEVHFDVKILKITTLLNAQYL